MPVEFVLASRLALAAIFAVAAFGKLRNLDGFGRTLRSLGVPKQLSVAAAGLVAVFEASLAVALTLRIAPTATSVATALLLTSFAAASAVAMSRAVAIPCNCFGTSEGFLGVRTFIRSLLLAVPLAIYAFATKPASSPIPGGLSVAVVSLALGLAGVLFARWVLAANHVMNLFQERRRDESSNLGKLIAKGVFREAAE